ncbi:MAG: hypothetical protein RMJ19_03045, partial [Gemmatales bacterium]|nr:hypothetical protein [Gemmatales bacterium]MDW8174624.1 hypothetical protein [Gemmatales bacterium]
TPQEIIRHPTVIAKYLGQTFHDSLPSAPSNPSIRGIPANDTATVPQSPVAENRHAESYQSTVSCPAATLSFARSETPAESAKPPAVLAVLQQERLRQRLEWLSSERRHDAEKEFLQAGPGAVPILLEALERRDPELRHRAALLLERILGQGLGFDPYAPEAERRQALIRLREQFFRLAG